MAPEQRIVEFEKQQPDRFFLPPIADDDLPGVDPQQLSYDFATDAFPVASRSTAELKKHISAVAKGMRAKLRVRKGLGLDEDRFHRIEGEMWRAIVLDLLDKLIVLVVFAREGFREGFIRTLQTRIFFLEKIRGNHTDVDDLANMMHELAGIAYRDEEGNVAIKDEFEASFAFVAATLIKCMMDFHERETEGASRDSEKGRALEGELAEFWYSVAQLIGLRHRPGTEENPLDDHRAFVASHTHHSIAELTSDPKALEKAREVFIHFTPTLARLGDLSELEYMRLLREREPHLYHTLRLQDFSWSAHREEPLKILSTFLGRKCNEFRTKVRQMICGLTSKEQSQKMLRSAAIGEGHRDMAVRLLYHMGNLNADLEFPVEHYDNVSAGDVLLTVGSNECCVILKTTASLAATGVGAAGAPIMLRDFQRGSTGTVGVSSLYRSAGSQERLVVTRPGNVRLIRIPASLVPRLREMRLGNCIDQVLFPRVQAVERALREQVPAA